MSSRHISGRNPRLAEQKPRATNAQRVKNCATESAAESTVERLQFGQHVLYVLRTTMDGATIR